MLFRSGNILLFKLDGRKNGVVICDLAVVGYAGNVRSNRNVGEKRKDVYKRQCEDISDTLRRELLKDAFYGSIRIQPVISVVGADRRFNRSFHGKIVESHAMTIGATTVPIDPPAVQRLLAVARWRFSNQTVTATILSLIHIYASVFPRKPEGSGLGLFL